MNAIIGLLAPRRSRRSSPPSSATTSARSTTPATSLLRRHQRHPRLLEDRGRQARHREPPTSGSTRCISSRHDAHRRRRRTSKGLEFLAHVVAGRCPERLLGDPLRLRPDSDQLRQQRGQVHRARRDRAARRSELERTGDDGAAQVLRCATPASA
ncbi:MAG: hypothetical protein MZW92_75305 [Comamonadaceae bacterium]|nr:hypothetical protein [Comamonadaceae bacterium]